MNFKEKAIRILKKKLKKVLLNLGLRILPSLRDTCYKGFLWKGIISDEQFSTPQRPRKPREQTKQTNLHITGGRVHSIKDGFRRHPFHR